MDNEPKKPAAPVVVENKDHSPQIHTEQPGTPQPMSQLDPNQWFKKDPGKPESARFKNLQIKKFLFIVTLVMIFGGAGYFAYGAYQSASKLAESKVSEENGKTETSTPSNSTTGKTPSTTTDEPVVKKPSGSDDNDKPSSGTTTGGSSSGGNTGGGGSGSSETPPEPLPKTYTINYLNSCYSPANQTINVGDTIKFVNDSNKYMWPASDNHPSHNLLSDFDAGRSIAPGGTYKYTFEDAGTWGYHDHNRPNCDGTITVKR